MQEEHRPPRFWGARSADFTAPWPADGRADPDCEVWLRAVDVGAQPTTVFRWLCQLRAAPYSYDWIDNFGRTSPRTLTPGLEDLAVGQTFMSISELTAFEPGRSITLEARGFGARVFGALIVTYRVVEAEGGGARLAAKLYVPAPRSLPRRIATRLFAWGDLVMMRKQLLTLKALAEGMETAPARP